MKQDKNIQKKAQRKLHKLRRWREDPRYTRVIGKLVSANLLTHTHIPSWGGPVSLEEALWAAEIEPRIGELIPAIVLKKPRLFRFTKLPEDLASLVRDIRRGKTPPDFRGTQPSLYLRWVSRIGHRGKEPSLIKTFRFSQKDIQILDKIKRRTGLSEIAIVREGLKRLNPESLLPAHRPPHHRR